MPELRFLIFSSLFSGRPNGNHEHTRLEALFILDFRSPHYCISRGMDSSKSSKESFITLRGSCAAYGAVARDGVCIYRWWSDCRSKPVRDATLSRLFQCPANTTFEREAVVCHGCASVVCCTRQLMTKGHAYGRSQYELAATDVAVCNGDSGAGLVFQDEFGGSASTTCLFYLQASSANGPLHNDNRLRCDSSKYAIFTRVGAFKIWIEEALLAN